ncbi:MAG: DUF3305 domain-containing protein [Geminicoccales bacterium]
MTERSAAMPLGVVVERRRSRSPWQDWIWRPVSVIAGAPPVGGEWRVLVREDDWVRYHAATLPLELHRTETEAYLVNLSQQPPRVYVVLRPATQAGPYAFRPLLVTASPFEAESYLESGDEIVEGVPMPQPVAAWVRAFVDRHHVAQPFVKRKRSKGDDVPAGGSSWSDRPKRLKAGSGSGEDV